MNDARVHVDQCFCTKLPVLEAARNWTSSVLMSVLSGFHRDVTLFHTI